MQNKKKIIPEIYNFLRPKQTKNLARFGIQKDGGYIVEKDVVAKVNHLVSFGMSDEFSFETIQVTKEANSSTNANLLRGIFESM